jgi:hypothetical protein
MADRRQGDRGADAGPHGARGDGRREHERLRQVAVGAQAVSLGGDVDQTRVVVAPGPRPRGRVAPVDEESDLQHRGSLQKVLVARYGRVMSVTNQRATCPGPLIEQQPGVGECARGDDCEVLALKDDYLAYRNAHMRVTNEWQQR